ncbi:MAG: Fic family protein [Magnetococcales bacterium]|nr:Fic family protein [Magnetococcales bacterium]
MSGYHFIANLEETSSLENTELKALAEIWQERRERLQESDEYQEFLKKMQREWAIETGIIERLYSWDRGITEVLIEQGIEASLIAHRGGIDREEAEHYAAVMRDHYSIVDGLFSFVKSERDITESYIKELHAGFTTHQDTIEAQTEEGRRVRVPLLKGTYKEQPNNPLRRDGLLHTYCPPVHVQQEMSHLVSWYQEWEKRKTPPEILSAFLHHRFTQIHPFQDGNGRVARALASLVFLKRGLFPVVIRDSERKEYIQALEKADGGDIKPLCDLFARNQRESILAALGIEQSVYQARHAEEILSSGLQLLKDYFSSETSRMDAVFDHAERLRLLAKERFVSIVDQTDAELPIMTPPGRQMYRARSASEGNDNQEKRHYFRNEILQVAGKYKYRPDFSRNCSWASLTIRTINHFQFVVAFHGMGTVHKGIMAAASFTLFRVPRGEDQAGTVTGMGGTETTDIRPASPDFFQFNHVEPWESIEKRFRDWLESSLTIALAEWHRSIAGTVAS